MYPVLFHIGPIPVYSYGLMLGLAFMVGNLLITSELKRRGEDPNIATTITMFALIGGIVGAKVFHILENLSAFAANPGDMLFSSGGLTWYGGFLVATLLIFFYFRRRKMSMLAFADIAAPALAIGYGFGRMGCQLAGDGDYGIPTDLPWAMTYTNGTVPTLSALNPELAQKFTELFPNLPVPVDIAVHPTPIYEILLAIAVFSFLFLRRARPLPLANQFGWFLILHSICRFFIEFIRLNSDLVLGFSQAQIISVALIGWGVYLVLRPPAPVSVLSRKPSRRT